jgi:hypothetical protein
MVSCLTTLTLDASTQKPSEKQKVEKVDLLQPPSLGVESLMSVGASSAAVGLLVKISACGFASRFFLGRQRPGDPDAHDSEVLR